MAPDELVPITARALARAQWEAAADWAGTTSGRAAAEEVYGRRIAGQPFEQKLIAGARAVLARASALSAEQAGQSPLTPDAPDRSPQPQEAPE